MRYEIQSVSEHADPKYQHRIMQAKSGSRELWFVPAGSEIGYSLMPPSRTTHVKNLDSWAGVVKVIQEPVCL